MTIAALNLLGPVLMDTAPPQQPQNALGFDPLLIGMLAILAVMVFFMFRNSRKRKADAEQVQKSMVPGVEVMTNYGLFGTLKSVDEVAGTALIEIAPGTTVKVHRQTLAKVIDPAGEGLPRSVEEAMEIAEREQAEREQADSAKKGGKAKDDEPQFGERLPEADDPTKPSNS